MTWSTQYGTAGIAKLQDLVAKLDNLPIASLSVKYAGDLSAAISDIGSTPAMLAIDTDHTLAAPVTIPKTLTILPAGGIITLDVHDLTVNSAPIDTLRQWINQDSTGVADFSGESISHVRPEWWGAKPDEPGDDAPYIQQAVDSLGTNEGGIVQCAKGVYDIQSQIHVSQNRIGISGVRVSGSYITTFQYSASVANTLLLEPCCILFEHASGPTTSLANVGVEYVDFRQIGSESPIGVSFVNAREFYCRECAFQDFYGNDANGWTDVEPAQVVSTEGPFNLANGDQFTVNIDGGGAETITFDADDFSDPTAATAAEVVAALNGLGDTTSWSGAATAYVMHGNEPGTEKIRIVCNNTAATTTLQIADGTGSPNAEFSLPTSLITGTQPRDFSIGIRVSGHQMGEFKNVFIEADQPIHIQKRAAGAGLLDADYMSFNRVQCSPAASSTKHAVYVDPVTALFSTEFRQFNSNGGAGILKWINYENLSVSSQMLFENCRQEQADTEDYPIHIELANQRLRQLTLTNVRTGSGSLGPRLRGVTPQFTNCAFDVAASSGKLAMDLNYSCSRAEFRNIEIAFGTTIELGGLMVWQSPATAPPDFSVNSLLPPTCVLYEDKRGTSSVQGLVQKFGGCNGWASWSGQLAAGGTYPSYETANADAAMQAFLVATEVLTPANVHMGHVGGVRTNHPTILSGSANFQTGAVISAGNIGFTRSSARWTIVNNIADVVNVNVVWIW